MRVRLLRDWGDDRHAWRMAGSVIDVEDATGVQLLIGDSAERVGGLPHYETAIQAPVATAARTKPPTIPKKKKKRK